MVMLEFEKAKQYHAEEKYMDKVGSYNAAMTTRLAAPFAHSNAAMYGDSRFGSVKAAHWMWKEHKTHSAFDIKTATALFPRKHLIRLCPKENHAVIVMTAKVGELEMYAIGQRRGPSVHTFLSTFGTFLKEIPLRFPKVTSMDNAPWVTPSILNKVTLAQPGIDAHNRQNFDQIGMQYAFPTRCFETRFSQHYLFPTTYVNAINYSSYSMPTKYGAETTKTMALELATSMVHNAAWVALKNGAGGGPPPLARQGRPALRVLAAGTRRLRRRGISAASTAALPLASLRASTCSSPSPSSKATRAVSSSDAGSATSSSRGAAPAAPPRTPSFRFTPQSPRVPRISLDALRSTARTLAAGTRSRTRRARARRRSRSAAARSLSSSSDWSSGSGRRGR